MTTTPLVGQPSPSTLNPSSSTGNHKKPTALKAFGYKTRGESGSQCDMDEEKGFLACSTCQRIMVIAGNEQPKLTLARSLARSVCGTFIGAQKLVSEIHLPGAWHRRLLNVCVPDGKHGRNVGRRKRVRKHISERCHLCSQGNLGQCKFENKKNLDHDCSREVEAGKRITKVCGL